MSDNYQVEYFEAKLDPKDEQTIVLETETYNNLIAKGQSLQGEVDNVREEVDNVREEVDNIREEIILLKQQIKQIKQNITWFRSNKYPCLAPPVVILAIIVNVYLKQLNQ